MKLKDENRFSSMFVQTRALQLQVIKNALVIGKIGSWEICQGMLVQIRYQVSWINMCAVTQSCLTLCNSMDCSPPRLLVHGIFQARNPGSSHFLLQGIFPTQGLNLHLLLLLHWQADSLPLSHLGSPNVV